MSCDEYKTDLLREVLEKGLNLVGGRELFRPGEKILLKPNLLAADPPERAVTTHPEVFRAVAQVLQDCGVKLVFGDSPGIGSLPRVARKAGLLDAARELGIEMADFTSTVPLHSSEATQNRNFLVAAGVLACDGLVSLPKLKTHGLMRMTGAVKNQFGCIPGLLKGEFHLKLPDQGDFARMLVDLNLALKPRLYILDGIVAMEGNGPRGGQPRQVGILAISTDPVALDATVCRLLGLEPRSIPTIVIGDEAGLGKSSPEEIEILGDFRWPGQRLHFATAHPPGSLTAQAGRLRQSIVPRPVIDKNRCQYCGICASCCPVKPSALNWQGPDSLPTYDYQRCLRCYCCQEMCPEGAISLYVPLPGRILNGLRPREAKKGT
ncbi:MAG: DUF362 domain-containing protein [Syntrophomonadaceae bacterium]